MSSVSRDEGGRSRRRRRRGPSSSSSQSTNNNSNISHPRSTPSIPSNSSSYNRRTNHPSNRSTNYQQQQQQRQREEKEELQRRKEQEEKEKERIELEKRKAGEAQQEKIRQQRLEHAQKRFQQRKLNLSYISSSSAEPPTTERLSDSQLRQLDSSLRKCTGFIRKIRSSGITEDSANTLITEARSLNLSRYISEVITAILEAKIRSADVDPVLLLCGELHRRYEDFSQQFATTLSNIVINPASNATQRDLITRKSAIRILIEMILLGMITDVSLLLTALKQLVRGSKDKKEEGTNNLTIIVAFIRAGARALLPHVTSLLSSTDTQSKKNSLTEVEEYSWEDDIISDSTKNSISSALQSYYTSEITEMLKDATTSLETATTNVNRSTQVRGTPDEVVSNAFESAKQHYEKVLSSAKIVAEALDVPPFEPGVVTAPKSFGSTETYAVDSSQVLISNPFTQSTKTKSLGTDTDQISDSELPFESEEQRLFYNELLDFSDEANNNGARSSNVSKLNDGLKEGSRTSSAGDSSRSTRGGTSKQTSEGRRRGSEKGPSLDKLLGRLPTIESKENADLFVQNFVVATEGSKNGTKKFIKSLCTVPPQKLNLLPAYARMAANLQTRFPDIPSTVAASLEEEFRFLVGKPDVDEKNLAACSKTARYIGEYVKFGLIDTAIMFDLMALCMKDFTAHRVDAICHMLESCGRFVYRTPSSHIRMSNILETLQRIKSVRNLEARHNALVDTAYYATKGSMGNKIQKKTRPPIHEYIRHLIYYRLDGTNISWTHQQLLKLPWDEELENYIIKKFVKISRARFSTISHASILIANLEKHKPGLVIGIVDALLEAIRSGMEKNDGRDSQRRIAEIHLLGEMHKRGVVDEKLIYNVLYQTITIGKDVPELEQHGKNEPQVSGSSLNDQQLNDSQLNRSMFSSAQILDPPRDFFRVHLVCELMESCGRFMVARNRRKLEVFWIFFERYLFFKASQAGSEDHIPLSVNHVVSDVFEHVLVKPKRNLRQSKHSSRGPEGYSYRRREGSANSESTTGIVTTFSRCRSLKEALEAVNGIENHPSDAALVTIPVREVVNSDSFDVIANQKNQLSRSQNVTDSNGMDSSQSAILNSLDSNGKEKEMNANEQDSYSNDSYSNGSGEDREVAADDSFSGDADDEEDQLPNGIHDKSVSIYSEDEMRDDNDEDDDDLDEDEEIDEEEDDDEDVLADVTAQPPQTEEEEAWAKELAAFTAESVQSARANSSRVTKFDRMTIPMSLMTQKMEEEKAAAAAQAAKSLNDVDSESDSDPGTRKKNSQPERSVEFKMLLRKGGKSQLQGLHVPETSSLAVAAKESETADAARHEETKRLVLRSRTVLNDDTDDLEDEVPLQAEQHARERDENIRKQRSQDQAELLSTLFRPRNRR